MSTDLDLATLASAPPRKRTYVGSWRKWVRPAFDEATKRNGDSSNVTAERQNYGESSAVGTLLWDDAPAVAVDDLASGGQAQTRSSAPSTS